MKTFGYEKLPCSARPIHFDEEKCLNCNICVNSCPIDVFLPDKEGKHPVIAYPGECIYCGACVMDCPVKGAIRLEHPLMNQTKFILN